VSLEIQKSWALNSIETSDFAEFMRELGVSKTTARILWHRQIRTVPQAKRFLNVDLSHLHDPFLMADMQKACERIVQAITKKQKICIYGDYDVDGCVATALLVLFFRDLGHEVVFYIPCRQKEGYSLNPSAVQTLKNQGVDLLITVDNGTMAHESVNYAQSLGLDVIITDHHQTADTLPQAFAVINPQRSDCAYPFKGLCGAGVAFKLAMALRQHLRGIGYFSDRVEPHLKQYFDLLCLSTICDVVPLVDENRLFVKEGLKHLRYTARVGLRALKAVCSVRDHVSVSDVGFKMGPRLNAAGRLDDASYGVKLLTSTDPEQARFYAAELDRLNIERREIERNMADQAVAKILQTESSPNALVVFDETWHMGVAGIVASRLVEKFHCPAFVLCRSESGEIRGSGRSFGSINLVKALSECADVLQKFGGHEAAAGVTLLPDAFETFKKRFSEAVAKQSSDHASRQNLCVDDELSADTIQESLMQELESLEPFGLGNAAPLFVSRDLSLISKRVVGESHLKLKFKTAHQFLEGIAFNKAGHFERIGQNVAALFHLERNRYLDQNHLQLVIREIL